MKAYLGITDSDWIATLSVDGPEVAQANFWNPGGTKNFRALQHGELFLFKTHSARGDRIVGGAVFDGFVFMRVDEAWETFGLACQRRVNTDPLTSGKIDPLRPLLEGDHIGRLGGDPSTASR